MGKSTTVETSREDFSVVPVSLETTGENDGMITFPDATKYQGYLKEIAQLKSALYGLGIYVCGKGFEVSDIDLKILTENFDGAGKETITSILLNHFVMSKVIGDSFLEIVRWKDGTLINLIPIGAERMKVVYTKRNRIKEYIVTLTNGKERTLQPNQVFHKINEKIGDEQRGQSVIPALQWVIDATEEAKRDGRLVFHRNVFPLMIIEYNGNNTIKRDQLLIEYADAIKNGTAIVVPKGVLTITTADVKIQDPIGWLRFLTSHYYEVVRIPRVIATSEGTTEAGGKVSYLTFEPFYTYEQTIYEEEIWQQLAIRIKFKRPPSLGGTIQEDEAKNTGQVAVQPNDVAATLTPE